MTHTEGVNALTVMQQTMTFPLAEGFPVITERSIRSFWRKPIGELCAFINGATTLREFEEFGVEMREAYPRMLAHLDAERARNKAVA